MPRPGKQTTERAKDFKGTLRQLLSALRQYKLSLIVVMVFAILSTIFNIAGPKILAKATTALATGWIAKLRGIGSIDFAYIGKILLTLLAMYLCSAAFSFIQGWLMTGLSQKVCYDFRRQISEKINRLPLAYFEKRTVGEVLSRITNDVDTLGQSLNQSVTQLITSITTMIGVLIMMLSISPKMTLIALLILPVSLALVMLVVRFSQKYFKAQQAILGVVNGQVEEVYSGHNVVKAFNREAVVLNDFNAANDKLYESAWKSQFLSGLMMPIMNFVGNLGYVAVAIVGSIFAANGTITIGDIQAFIQYVKNFTQPIQQLSQVSNMLQSMAAAAERVFEFLNEPEEDQQADPARRADPACIDGQVTFSHVRFGYTPEKTIIHDFSCEVKPGQKVAIVGPTGAGKTSALRALEQLGGLVLDCDAIYHELLRTGGALRGAIAGAFGPVFAADGGLDRQKLGNVVFGDPAALETLNGIIYARLPRELRRRMDQSDAAVAGLDAINLIESGLDGLCRRTVAVIAPAETRVARIMARDGIPEAYARLRVRAQKDEAFYRAHCTDVLVNDCGSAAAFTEKARQALETILKEERA